MLDIINKEKIIKTVFLIMNIIPLVLLYPSRRSGNAFHFDKSTTFDKKITFCRADKYALGNKTPHLSSTHTNKATLLTSHVRPGSRAPQLPVPERMADATCARRL